MRDERVIRCYIKLKEGITLDDILDELHILNTYGHLDDFIGSLHDGMIELSDDGQLIFKDE